MFNDDEILKHLKNGTLNEFLESILKKKGAPRNLEEAKEFLIQKIKEIKTEDELKIFGLKMGQVALNDYKYMLNKNNKKDK